MKWGFHVTLECWKHSTQAHDIKESSHSCYFWYLADPYWTNWIVERKELYVCDS